MPDERETHGPQTVPLWKTKTSVSVAQGREFTWFENRQAQGQELAEEADEAPTHTSNARTVFGKSEPTYLCGKASRRSCQLMCGSHLRGDRLVAVAILDEMWCSGVHQTTVSKFHTLASWSDSVRRPRWLTKLHTRWVKPQTNSTSQRHAANSGILLYHRGFLVYHSGCGFNAMVATLQNWLLFYHLDCCFTTWVAVVPAGLAV